MKPESGKKTLLYFFLLLPQLKANNAQINTTSYEQVRLSGNLIFRKYLLWNVIFNTPLQCADLCAKRKQCVAFTVTKVTPDSVTCRGHSKEMTSGGNTLQGSKYYRVRKKKAPLLPNPEALGSTWLTKACTKDSECSQANTKCFAKKCLCTPGYYFSLGKDSCQISCLKSNLQRDFVMYPRWYIRFNNVKEDSVTFKQCRELCTSSFPNCVTIEYNFEVSKCFVAEVTALDRSSSWTSASVNLSYWQRACA